MDELLEQFLIEGRDLVADAQAELATLLRDPANAGAIDGAFRAVHTLKGSVAIFDMAPAERVLHACEELLERARKGIAALSADTVKRLIGSIDQADRWIDEMERRGALGPDASGIAARLLEETEPSLAEPVSADLQSWATALAERERATLESVEGPLTAFRYTPDADAFFRGDDPLALVAAVPALCGLAILPVADGWPSPSSIDPFACQLVIEGLSTAPIDELHSIFRLVPDQIEYQSIDANAAEVAEERLQASAATLRVDAARVDTLADGVAELIIATNAFASVADRADGIDQGLALAIRAAQAELGRAVGAVQRSVTAVRLVPLAPALRRLPRLVREIAAGLGKKVDFRLSGEQVEVDKQIADGLFEPLLHLVRNAVDHGIEPTEDRIAAGKPAEGSLSLRIEREGEDIVVTLADDGAGIDPARVRAVAIARGLMDRDAADALSDAAATALIFTPGFSTATQISGVSGRGVGMDAVQAAIDRMRGRIEIESRIGQGTRFILRLPANALTTRLLVIEVGRDRYAVPFDQIAETVRVEGDRLMPVGTGTACVLRNRTVPVLSLAELLGSAEAASLPAKLLVTRAGGEPVALRVDGFSDRIDAAVRRPTGLLAGLPSVAGTAVLGDGGVLVVLNLPELVG